MMTAHKEHNQFLPINFPKISSWRELERVGSDSWGSLMSWRGAPVQCGRVHIYSVVYCFHDPMQVIWPL